MAERYSVSQTAAVALSYNDGHVAARRCGQVVQVSYFYIGASAIWTPGPGQFVRVAQLPAGLRPVADSWSGVCRSDGDRQLQLVVGTDGLIQLVFFGSGDGLTWSDVRASVTFVAA